MMVVVFIVVVFTVVVSGMQKQHIGLEISRNNLEIIKGEVKCLMILQVLSLVVIRTHRWNSKP